MNNLYAATLHSFTIKTTTKKWVFPKHRFFEWESKDEKVCRFLGIGYEESVEQVIHYPIGSIMVKGPNEIVFRPLSQGIVK